MQRLYPLEVVGEHEHLFMSDLNEGKNNGAQASRGVRTTPRFDADLKARVMLDTQP